MVKRQVRWNRFVDKGEQVRLRYRYVVAIVNQPREIGIIERKLLDELAPADDLRDICDRVIPKTRGLHCKVFSFSSDVGRINRPQKIYSSSQFCFDRNLIDADEIRLSNYLEKLTDSD